MTELGVWSKEQEERLAELVVYHAELFREAVSHIQANDYWIAHAFGQLAGQANLERGWWLNRRSSDPMSRV